MHQDCIWQAHRAETYVENTWSSCSQLGSKLPRMAAAEQSAAGLAHCAVPGPVSFACPGRRAQRYFYS